MALGQARMELVADYWQNDNDDRASRREVGATKIGEKILYCLVAQIQPGASRLPHAPDAWPSLEIDSDGTVHNIQGHGEGLTVVTTAMLAQVAFLRLAIDHRVDREHTVHTVTTHPEVYQESLNMEITGMTEDSTASLSGTVRGVLDGAHQVMQKEGYFLRLYSRPPIIGDRRLIEGGADE